MTVKCYVSFCSRAIHFLIHLRLYMVVVMITNTILLFLPKCIKLCHLCRIIQPLLLRVVYHSHITIIKYLMYYYTSNKPISHLSLTFSCLLNSFLLLPLHFPSFAFYIYRFFLDNPLLYKFNLLLKTTILLISIFNSVYITQILVPPHHVLYTSKCCSNLESKQLNTSSDTTLSAFPPYCSFTSC